MNTLRRAALCVAALTCLVPATVHAQLFPDLFGPGRPGARPGEQPNDPSSELRSRVDAAYQSGNYEQAVSLATQVIDTDPSQPFAWYQRASARIEIGKRTNSTKLVREGIADAREGLRLGGRKYRFLYVPYLYGLTTLSELEGKPSHAEQGITVINPVLDQPDLTDQDRTQLLYQRGLARLTMREFSAAAGDFREASRVTPDFMAAFLALAQTYITAGNPTEAKAAFAHAIDSFPRSPLVYNNRGTYLQSIGESEAAVSDFTRAIEIDPRFAMAHSNRGFALASLNRPADAEKDYRRALQLAPQQPLTMRLLGSSMLAQGRSKAALQEYQSAAQLAPQSPESWADIGFARFYSEDFKGAAAEFDQALKLNPKLGFLLSWRGVALARAGKKDDAQALLTKAAHELADPWQKKLCEMLTGKATDDELREAAKDKSPAVQRERLCEAEFFIGQQKLIAGEASEATANFQAAKATKAYRMAAYRGAQYALKDFATASR